MDSVIQAFEDSWPQTIESLKRLVKIPSVSFPGFPVEKVEQSAQEVAALLKESGLENVEIMRVGDVHPYVYGEWLNAPGQPTLLLYAHHDVQPPGREEVWETSPFEPVEKQGPGGMRLYGRGSADDKAGIMVHVAAISSYLKSQKKLPVNIKVLIEGEEEIGSAHLAEFLKLHHEKLSADVLVLTDTANFDCGIPALTVSLRGMVGLDVEMRSLDKTIHSGLWGGPLVDPAIGLSKVLAQLVDDSGQINIPEIKEMIPKLSEQDRIKLESLPFDEENFREQAGVSEGVSIHLNEKTPYHQLWSYPSLNVNAIQVSSREQANNIINDIAWTKLTLRLPAGMDPEKVQDHLIDFIKESTPWGLKVDFKKDECASGWKLDSKHFSCNAFECAKTAFKKSFGVSVVEMGCGASIPFVEPFVEVLKGAPALLIGVEDPYTNAHGENESLLLDDFKKVCLGEIYLFEEIAKKGLEKI